MKKLTERVKDHFDAHLAFASVAFNLIIQLFDSFSNLSFYNLHHWLINKILRDCEMSKEELMVLL